MFAPPPPQDRRLWYPVILSGRGGGGAPGYIERGGGQNLKNVVYVLHARFYGWCPGHINKSDTTPIPLTTLKFQRNRMYSQHLRKINRKNCIITH